MLKIRFIIVLRISFLSYSNILGITLHQLIYELSNGIRLPEPESCPTSMADLIQQCFKQEPTERPSFSDVKEVISEEYAKLRRTPTTFSQDEQLHQYATIHKKELQYADLDLENKYLEMRIKNREHQEKQTNSSMEKEVVLDGKSLTASFKNEEPRYLSLHDVTSSANQLPALTVEKRQSISQQRSNTEDAALLRTPIYSLSPGSNGLKRFFSYSGEDPTLPLQPEQLTLIPMTPAKSYPNPAYNLFLSNFDSNGTTTLRQYGYNIELDQRYGKTMERQ